MGEEAEADYYEFLDGALQTHYSMQSIPLATALSLYWIFAILNFPCCALGDNYQVERHSQASMIH